MLKKAASITTAWIPEEFARLGKILELKQDDGWENGWRVVTIATTRMDEKALMERERDYKHTREASDV